MDVELYASQLTLLSSLKAEYALADESKVVRALIDYAIRDGDVTKIFFTPAESCDCGVPH